MKRNVHFVIKKGISNGTVGHSPGPSARPKPPGRETPEARQPPPATEVVIGEGAVAGKTPKAEAEVAEAEAAEVQVGLLIRLLLTPEQGIRFPTPQEGVVQYQDQALGRKTSDPGHKQHPDRTALR